MTTFRDVEGDNTFKGLALKNANHWIFGKIKSQMKCA